MNAAIRWFREMLETVVERPSSFVEFHLIVILELLAGLVGGLSGLPL